MANPLVAAAPVTFLLGPGQATDNITSLPNNQAKGLGSVGTAQIQYYDDNVGPFKITSGVIPGSPNGTGIVSLILVVGENGTLWTGGIDPTVNTNQSALIVSPITPIQPSVVFTTSNTAYYFPEFSIRQLLFGFMPTFWSIVVFNQSGAALNAAAANHSALHTLISYA